MQLGDLAHYGQTQPGPLRGFRQGRVDLVKAFKDSVLLIAGDADAGIGKPRSRPTRRNGSP